ncbi:MAG: LuxR C-terminal-related transcriptional regulator, partial [Acidimicrobiia bacterium]
VAGLAGAHTADRSLAGRVKEEGGPVTVVELAPPTGRLLEGPVRVTSLAFGSRVISHPVFGILVVDGAGEKVRLEREELELWRLVAHGLETAAIAGRLYLSERTAKRRINHLLRILGVDNRAQAAALAGRSGILDRAEKRA